MKQQCTKRPNVNFVVVKPPIHDLWSHTYWSATSCSDPILGRTHWLGQSKVANFEVKVFYPELSTISFFFGIIQHLFSSLCLNKDVFDFEVSMHHVMFVEVLHAFNHLANHMSRFVFRQSLTTLGMLGNEWVQVALVTVVKEQVEVILGLQWVMEFDDIWMRQGFKDVYFLFEFGLWVWFVPLWQHFASIELLG